MAAQGMATDLLVSCLLCGQLRMCFVHKYFQKVVMQLPLIQTGWLFSSGKSPVRPQARIEIGAAHRGL